MPVSLWLHFFFSDYREAKKSCLLLLWLFCCFAFSHGSLCFRVILPSHISAVLASPFATVLHMQQSWQYTTGWDQCDPRLVTLYGRSQIAQRNVPTSFHCTSKNNNFELVHAHPLEISPYCFHRRHLASPRSVRTLMPCSESFVVLNVWTKH